ncbi:19149_t:CDS:1, partial [Dentiscutata erythropus]
LCAKVFCDSYCDDFGSFEKGVADQIPVPIYIVPFWMVQTSKGQGNSPAQSSNKHCLQ